MTETGHVLRQNNERIVEFLTLLRQQKTEMDFLIERQLQEQGKIQNDIEKLTFKLSLLSKSLNQRIKARNDYEATIKEVEARYRDLVEASGRLLSTVENKAERLDEIMDKKIGTIEEGLPKEALLPLDNPPDNCITDTPQKPFQTDSQLDQSEVMQVVNTVPKEVLDKPKVANRMATLNEPKRENDPDLNIFGDLNEIMSEPGSDPSQDQSTDFSETQTSSNHSVYNVSELPIYDRQSPTSEPDSSDSDQSVFAVKDPNNTGLLLKIGSDRSFDEPPMLDKNKKEFSIREEKSKKTDLPQPITKGHDEAVQAFRDAYGRQHMVPAHPATKGSGRQSITSSKNWK